MCSIIIPYFKPLELKLRDVTAQHIQDFYTEQMKRVSGKTVKRYHANIHKAFIKKNNIRNLRLYDCRHTAASIMLKNGVSMKQIQMILGHSDYATTANIYSHLDYADKVSATKEMKNILYGNE